MSRLATLYQKFALILFNTLLLFVVVNVVASYIDGPISKKRKVPSIITSRQLLEENPQQMQANYDGRPIEAIAAIIGETPNISSHPVLPHMTQPCSGRYYHVGFEGCRYHALVNDSNVRGCMNNSTWLLGGSTAFGYGLPDNETLGYFLSAADSANDWVNFGAHTYHQSLELQKLVLLLRKGYRPQRVVLLDGLNDVMQLTSNHFEAAETPARPFHAFSGDFNIENLKWNRNLLYALPVVRLYYEYEADRLARSGRVNHPTDGNPYNKDGMFNTRSYLYYLVEEATETPVDSALLHKAEQYYDGNLSLLDALSRAYGFTYNVFYQPNGILYSNSDFVRNQQDLATDLRNYAAVKAIYAHMQQLLEQKRFAHVHDLSGLDRNCPHPYIDLTHYSQQMNRLLARAILDTLQADQSR